jgi:hypothetical protein
LFFQVDAVDFYAPFHPFPLAGLVLLPVVAYSVFVLSLHADVATAFDEFLKKSFHPQHNLIEGRENA